MKAADIDAPEGAGVVPTYAPLVLACAKHGIGKTTAFQLAKEGKLNTFKIGSRTFVMLDSLAQLPVALAKQANTAHG
ncbi:hypothetical protein [Arenimonas soli]|nr:hypothetical protein [Arenimonas soli]